MSKEQLEEIAYNVGVSLVDEREHYVDIARKALEGEKSKMMDRHFYLEGGE